MGLQFLSCIEIYVLGLVCLFKLLICKDRIKYSFLCDLQTGFLWVFGFYLSKEGIAKNLACFWGAAFRVFGVFFSFW